MGQQSRTFIGVMLTLFLAGCGGGDGSSPSSEQTHDLIFEGTASTIPEIFIRDAETGAVTRLFSSETIAMDPTPSPDGTKIAFVVADYIQWTGDIYVINRDGTNLRQLTFAPELDDQPSWSPDGMSIAYRSYRTNRFGDIWVMASDGKNPVSLTPDPLPGVTDEGRPAWSPDGTRIAYASNLGGNMDIWTMMASDGSDKQQITNTEDFDTEPAWSPDGSTIAFRRSGLSGADITLVSVNDGTTLPMVLDGDQSSPVWEKDGAGIVFVNQATQSARHDIYRVNADGTGLEPLVSDTVSGGSINPAFLRKQ